MLHVHVIVYIDTVLGLIVYKTAGDISSFRDWHKSNAFTLKHNLNVMQRPRHRKIITVTVRCLAIAVPLTMRINRKRIKALCLCNGLTKRFPCVSWKVVMSKKRFIVIYRCTAV